MKCGGCTLCCKLTSISCMDTVHGEYCKEYSHDRGCLIYTTRPECCQTFKCAYLQMEKVHPDLRPDKCGMMFEKINDTLMLGTTDKNIHFLSNVVKGQIKAFGREGISTMVQQFNPHKSLCFLVKGADKQKIIQALEDKANDSSLIY